MGSGWSLSWWLARLLRFTRSPGRGCGNGVVEFDGFQHGFGDFLCSVEDGLDCGAADQVRQAADHAAGALVQILVKAAEGSGLVVVQPEGLLEGRDEALPFLGVGKRHCFYQREADGDFYQREAAGDLAAAGAGEVAVSRHADTPSQDGSVTAGSATPYTTPVDVNP